MSFHPVPPRHRRLRFLAPIAALAAIGLAAWVPTVTASAATPKLPELSAQQVVAKALSVRVAGLSGSVRWSANLGIPDLGAVVGGIGGGVGGGDGFSLTSLLSGEHTVLVWYGGPDRQRLALPGSLSEVDFVHNGQRAWYYDSSTDTVTVYTLPARAQHQAAPDQQQANEPALTPDQIASRLLSHLTPSTSVSVISPVYVAGRASYQLVLAPAAGTAGAKSSTVRQITLAIDAATGLPLRLQVYAKGQSAPALQIGFTSVSFAMPSASEFAPRTGSTVRTKTLGHSGAASDGGPAGGLGLPAFVGPPWGAVVSFNNTNFGYIGGPISQASIWVNGPFGSAQLFQTSLVNALIFPDGHVFAGFATPSALETAAESASH